MSMSGMIVLTAIVIAFLIFGMVLAWGERQTRNLMAAGRSKEKRGQEVAEALMRSAKVVGMANNSAGGGSRKMAKN